MTVFCWCENRMMENREAESQCAGCERKDLDEGGLSPLAVRLIGFDVPCRCGHEDGLHDSNGRCAVIGCDCEGFACSSAQDKGAA